MPAATSAGGGRVSAIDAVRAARELLARPYPAQMRADGDREALRLLMIDRDNAVASAKTARTLLASVLVTAPAPLRERLGRLPRDRRARKCANLPCPRRADRQTRALHQTLARLGQRIIMLARAAAELEKQIAVVVEDLAPGVVAGQRTAREPPRRVKMQELVAAPARRLKGAPNVRVASSQCS
jgi:hypothetical protein